MAQEKIFKCGGKTSEMIGGGDMLTLTRRIGEEVRIGKDLRVKLVSIKGKQVRLGFYGDDNIEIFREEIFEKIKREQADILERKLK